jgi:hypothetical protein
MANPPLSPPSRLDLALGFAGVVAGGVLLAAYVTDIPPDLNVVRLALYLIGASAVVVGIQARQAVVATPLTWAVVVVAVAAHLLYLARLLLPYSPWHPFAGDSGMVLFVAGVAMWLADSAFGFMTLQLGVARRWGAIALGVGSALAVLGTDRLALTSAANPTPFGTLAMVGVALNGLGWILLGLELILPPRSGAARSRSRSELLRAAGE